MKEKTKEIDQIFAQPGTRDCEMKCDRKVIMTQSGPVVVCLGCIRIVIDNRLK
jgi:hypothetical protein